MNNVWYVLLVVVLWLTIGLGTAGVFVVRGGHRHRLWYLLGALLGPLFVPVAVERGRARTERVEFRAGPAPTDRSVGTGLRVLVGVDGSDDSDRALRAVARSLTGTASELVLVTVTSPDLGADEAEQARVEAHRLVERRARQLPTDLPPATAAVVTGDPVDALLEVADLRDVDLLVVGRHGHSIGDRFVGSVAAELAQRSTRAVLFGSLPGR